jgi:Tol biopolymer transport system component
VALLTYSHAASGGLCLARADGTHRLKLTGKAGDREAAWTRDGRYVAFVRTVAAGSRIVIADARGRVVRRFEVAAAVAHPTWAPDGRRIAYAVGTRIVVAARVGAVQLALPTGRNPVGTPAWSPTGSEIAYTDRLQTEQGDLTRIFVIDVDGAGRRLVASPASDPTWSPDAARLAYVEPESRFTDTGHIAIVRVDGTGARRLTVSEGAAPAWSANGRLIAFAIPAGTQTGIATIHPDGTSLHTIVSGASAPSWRPRAPLPKGLRRACR